MTEIDKSKYLIDPSKPRRKTRNRIRRLEKSIVMLEGIKIFAHLEDLPDIEKRIKHYKDAIDRKKIRYSNSLELCGIKKDISDAQQKILLNKEIIRGLHKKLASMKSYLHNAIDSFDADPYTQGAAYSHLKLKIIKSREEIQHLVAMLIKLGKEQSDLKKNLRQVQRSSISIHCNKEEQYG